MADFGNHPKQSSTDKDWLHAASWSPSGLCRLPPWPGSLRCSDRAVFGKQQAPAPRRQIKKLAMLAAHLITPSIPAHKSPRSFGPVTDHTAGRGFSHAFEARSSGFFRLAKDEEAVINELATCMSKKARESSDGSCL